MTTEAPLYPEHKPDPGPTSARTLPATGLALEQRSRWPGWIWAVPLTAFVIVVWLAVEQITSTGPLVTVIFNGGGGISAGTPVEYQGENVGHVQSVAFQDDLQHMRARIRLVPALAKHLGPGTEFWVSGPTLTNLASIKSIIAGPSIGILPQPGSAQREYVALSQAPLMQGVVAGRTFLLRTPQLGNIARGSGVFYRDLKVGTVQATHFEHGQDFSISIFVETPYDKLVHDDSRFWNAGAVQFSMQGTGPRLQVQSLASLLGGAVAFETPGDGTQGTESAAGHPFTLYDSRNAADFAPGRDAVVYRIVFGADAGGLTEGAPVMLAGKQVGIVQQTRLRYDAQAGVLRQPSTIAIDPVRVGLDAESNAASARRAVDALMEHLVAQGLRAQLGSSIPLVGPPDVELSFVPGAPAATLTGSPPEIPAASEGSGLQGVMAALNRIGAKLDGLPLDRIAADIHVATARLAAFSTSPKLARSLGAMERTTSDLERIGASARTDLPAILADLRRTSREAAETVAETRHMMGSLSGQNSLGLNATSLNQTLYELTRAAQAMRELADYLNRNPSALIRGRR
jgi:paraquat-inducible protein B